MSDERPVNSRLMNEKHEIYARHRAKGMLPSKAAVAAGFAAGSSIYSKLEADPDVLARIAELMEEYEMRREQMRAAAREDGKVVGQLTGVGKSWVISQLAENAQLARMDGDFKESNVALMKIGEHFGMWKGDGKDPNDKTTENTSVLDVDELNALTEGTQNALDKADDIALDKKQNDNLTERALRLIGSTVKSKVDMKTGSETDAGLFHDENAFLENEEDNGNNQG